MDELTVTRWQNLLSPIGERYTLSWERLVRMLTSRRSFEGDRKHSGWSPAAFRGDQRGLEHVESVQALCLDYDRGEPLEQVLARFPGMSLVLHTTRKHSPEEPRCRVVIRVSRPMSPFEFSALWRRFAQVAGEVDQAPKDPSRFWFTPGCAPDGEFIARVQDGEPLDVDAWLAKPEPRTERTEPKQGTERPTTPIVERARAYVAKMPAAIAGSGGHMTTWHVAIVLAKGFELNESQTLDVLREYNQRCEPPWKDKELAHKAKQAQSAKAPLGFVLEKEKPWDSAARRTIERIETDYSWVDDLIGDVAPSDGPADGDPEREAIQAEGRTKVDDGRSARLHFEDDLLRAAALRAAQATDAEQCMTTGHAHIDEQTGGYEKEFCWVIGGDTSWGKSSHAIFTYQINADLGFRPLIVSLEDGEKLYAQRAIARRAKISAHHMKRVRKGQAVFSTDEVARLNAVVRDASHRPMVLDARSRPVEWIAARIKAIVRDQGIDLVMVDYLQAGDNERKQNDRRTQLTYIARTLTDAIKISGAAGILYSQITVSEQKKTPDRHSLKESRDIANAAETVALGFIAEKAIERRTAPTIPEGAKVLFVDKVKDGPPKQLHQMSWDDDLACFHQVTETDARRVRQPDYFPNFDNEFDSAEERYR